MSCLEKRPEGRPASALALYEALGECAQANSWSEAQARAWWDKVRYNIEQAAAGRCHTPSHGTLAMDPDRLNRINSQDRFDR